MTDRPDSKASRERDSRPSSKPAERNQSTQRSVHERRSASAASAEAIPAEAEQAAEAASPEQGLDVGSSPGQDSETPNLKRSPARHSEEAADIERPSRSSAEDSLVNDSTGAFKERP